MSWTLRLAFRQLFPIGKKFPFYSLLSILGVTLGVTLLVIVQAVMLGFGREYQSKIISTSGHVQVFGDRYFEGADEIIDQIETDPDVVAATPFVIGKLMVLYRDRPAFPDIRGSDPIRETSVIPVNEFLHYGTWDDLDDSTVLLSSGLAHALGAAVGSRIEVYSPLMIHRFEKDEVFMPRELEVAGIFSVGWHTFDDNLMILSLRQMQELFGLGDGVHGISVKLKDQVDVDTFVNKWNARLPMNLFAYTWMDLNRDFLWILRFERNMMFFLLIFIVLVSAFAIMSSLLNHVVVKTREIGLLRALGASPVQIAQLFCFQGLWIGILGTACGIGLGHLGIHFRQEIVSTFARLTQSQAAIDRFYQFAELPAHIASNDLIQISIASLILSVLAGLIPALRAAFLKPAEALRNEH